MMFELICVSAEYFDDGFQMFFHNGDPKEPLEPPRYARLGGRDVLVRYCRRSSDGTAFQMLGMKIATAERQRPFSVPPQR